MSGPNTCPRCGSTRPSGASCPQCGDSAPRVTDGSRRAVVIGALAAGASVGLGTWALVRGSTTAVPQNGDWRSDWLAGMEGLRKAEALQRKSRRPMLVYFYTDWCGYCRRLEAAVFSTEKGRQVLDGVTKVRINPESGAEEVALARDFRVRGYPSLFLVPATGATLRLRSPQTPDELAFALSQART